MWNGCDGIIIDERDKQHHRLVVEARFKYIYDGACEVVVATDDYGYDYAKSASIATAENMGK